MENDFLKNLGKVPLVYHDSEQPREDKSQAKNVPDDPLVCAVSDTSDPDNSNTEDDATSTASEEGELRVGLS